ncbi:MAG TPA: cupin domain-containing protein [Polyangiaceae bacterium]|jgi:predicted cupin superfamily sugar epimerase|nr:cupin domain-containing protein [Polyangiaceae bacterium]
MNDDARAVVAALGLAAHPEGGFFRETFRASLAVGAPQGPRAASTAIYFLLPAGSFSALHRVRSDEVWHHYDGDPIELYTLGDDGEARVVRLGSDLARGDRPQVVVPAGIWQAAVPVGKRYSLCGCTVAPGFDFADFEMPSRAELLARFPSVRELVERLTRE